MNVLGHACVAGAIRPDDDEHALGAVLPDLVTMAGVRLGHAPAGTALADGVRCHHAADASFHSLPSFVTGTAAIRRDLLDAGLRTGPARAVAHVGFEMLLDGTLVGTDVEGLFRRAVARARTDAAVAAIAPAARHRWLAFADRLAETPPAPARYDDAAWVAQRLGAILRHRPRLALEEGDAPVVTAVLEHHAGEVRRHAPATFAALAGGVSLAFDPPSGG